MALLIFILTSLQKIKEVYNIEFQSSPFRGGGGYGF
jgi:hypothetical protein